MILTRAPLRVSLAGGGSDLPSFFNHDVGRVISFSIDKYVYLAFHHLFSGGIRIAYSMVEQVNDPNELNHPIFREVLKELKYSSSLEIGSFADVPANGTGLGSSSAFTNALIAGLLTLKNQPFTKNDIASMACNIEVEKCKQPIGFQDQWTSAIGGLNIFEFTNHNHVNLQRIELAKEKVEVLNQGLLLYYLGTGRTAANILQRQKSNIENCEKTRIAQKKIVELVEPMEQAVLSANLEQVGLILHENWRLKKLLANEISTLQIDEIYERALLAGAFGGKVVGAGGGGFLLLAVPIENREQFHANFAGLRELKFSIEFKGVSVVYDDRTH